MDAASTSASTCTAAYTGEGPRPEKYQHINEARFQIIPKASNPTFQNPEGMKPIVKDKLSKQRRK